MSSVIPFNVLAENPVQKITQGTIPSKVHTGTYTLTPEQLEAMNKISTESEVKISPNINVQSADPVRVIVQFKQAPAKVTVFQQQLAGNEISLTDAAKKVKDSHKKFKDYVQGLGKQNAERSVITPSTPASQPEIKITREYQHAFNGVAMTLPGTEVEKLLESGLVSQIFADHVVKLDPPGSEGSNTIPLKASNGQLAKSATSVENLSISEQNTSTTELKENYIPLSGIEDLHKDGVTGTGIKVGVLDTGIDYHHPDLTNAYKGYRKKDAEDPKTIDPTTVKGWDFVDEDADPMETTYQDWVNAGKPEGGSYYTSHGTHVSGTIAGQGENSVDSPALGVAPDVDLYSYRVLGPYGSGWTEDIIAGIDKAVKDGMNVINLSLGAAVNDPLYATSIAINNATIAGVTCTVSAGNFGPSEKTLGSPGAAAFAITVGASDFPMAIPIASATVGSETFNNMKLLGKGFHDQLETLVNKSYPIVNVGLGGEDDFKDGNGQPIDLTGKLALIQRGTYSLVDKVVNAKKAGAVAVIVYNNVDGEIDQYLSKENNFIPFNESRWRTFKKQQQVLELLLLVSAQL